MESATAPSQRGGAPALPNFWGFPLFVKKNDQIGRGNTYGEGMFLGGQSRHCICTNASRGLLTIAEFLVNTGTAVADLCTDCHPKMHLSSVRSGTAH